MRCWGCAETITELSGVQMKPCGHRFCHVCAHQISFGRDLTQDLCCPVGGCGKKVERVHCASEIEIAPAPRSTRKRARDDDDEPEATTEIRQETIEVKHYVPNADYDPFRALIRGWKSSAAFREGGWNKLLKSSGSSGGYLFTAAWSILPGSNNGIKISLMKFLLSTGGAHLPDKGDVDGAEAYFGMLHSSLLPLSSQPREKKVARKRGANNDNGADDSDDDEDDENVHTWTRRFKPLNELYDHLKSRDHRLLPRLIRRLMWGNSNLEATNRATQPKQALLVSHLASDLIMRSTNPQQEIGHVVDLLSYLFVHASQTEQHEVFSELRLITSRSASLRRKAEDTLEKMKTRFEIDPRGLISFTADNMQWLMNRQGTYKHCYTSGYFDTSEQQLLEEGILYDEPPSHDSSSTDVADGAGAAGSNSAEDGGEAAQAGSGRQLCRDPRIIWSPYLEENSEEVVLDEHYRSSESDVGERGRLIFTHIAVVLQGGLPDLEESGRRERTSDYSLELPLLYRYDSPSKLCLLSAKSPPPRSNNDGDGEDPRQRMTIYEANKIVVSQPIFTNFGFGSSITGICDHLNLVGDNNVAAWEEKKESHPSGTGADDPVSVTIILFNGDGAPTRFVISLKNAEAGSDSPKYDRIRPILGAFHARMHNFKKANTMHEELLDYILSYIYPNSNVKKDAYKNPADFNKPEKTMCVIVLAILTFVKERLKATGVEEASATDVWDYFREEAKKCSVTMALLVLVEDYENVMLYRSSERASDFDRYMAANRNSMPLNADTNSREYMPIMCDLFQWVGTRSEFEDAIHRNHGFTGKSENGENVALDYIHENYNLDVRKIVDTGKIAKGTNEEFEAKIEHAALSAPESAKLRNQRSPPEAQSRAKHWLSDRDSVEIFIKTMMALDKIGALGGGTIKVQGKSLDTSSCFRSPSTGGELPSLVLEQHPGGKLAKAGEQYFSTFHIKSQNKVSRTQADYKFLPVVSSTKVMAEEMDKRVKLATSTTYRTLNEVGSRDEIHDEIKKLQDKYDELEVPFGTSPKSKKKLLIDTLIAIRKNVYSHFQDEEEASKKEALLCCSSATSVESRTEALESVWHKQPDSVRSLEAFTTKHKL